MNKNQKGFGVIAVLLASAITAAICITGWFGFQSRNTTNRSDSTNRKSQLQTKITEINNLLESAAIEKLDGWTMNAKCGDAGGSDDFVLEPRPPDQSISAEQFTKLKSQVDPTKLFAGDDITTIIGDGWNIKLLHYNSTSAQMYPTIKLPEKTNEFPLGSQTCS